MIAGNDGEQETALHTIDTVMRQVVLEDRPQRTLLMMDMKDMSPAMKEQMHGQLRMKLTPGMQEGEHEGSIHDAMMKVMPKMKMMPESMQPGATPTKMIYAMLAGWRSKYGNLPDVEPISMVVEPNLPPVGQEGGEK